MQLEKLKAQLEELKARANGKYGEIFDEADRSLEQYVFSLEDAALGACASWSGRLLGLIFALESLL